MIHAAAGAVSSLLVQLAKHHGANDWHGFDDRKTGNDQKPWPDVVIHYAESDRTKQVLKDNEWRQSMATFTEELTRHLAAGLLQVIVQEFALADAAKAHETWAHARPSAK